MTALPPKADLQLVLGKWSANDCDFNRSMQHFIKIAEDGVYAGESMELSRFHGGRESRVVGPLEASRGTKVDRANVWQALNVC